MSGKLLDTYPAGSTVYALFSSYDANGASVTLTGLAVTDIEIYKNGSTTQRASDAGYALLDTDGIDFDGITGIHGLSIDLSDNTDAGFFAAGSQYHVVVSAVTIASQTVSFILGSFRIVAAEGTAGTPKVDLSAAAVQAIWDALTSALTTVGSIGKLLVDNINATISSRLASAGYTAPLDAAGTRAAVGLAAANLDTQLAAIDDAVDTEVAAILAAVDTEVAAIKAKTDNLPASPAATGDIPSAASIAAAVWAYTVEGSYSMLNYMRLFGSALLGKLSGAATATNTFRDTGDTKNRITATVDADGNRTAVTLDGT